MEREGVRKEGKKAKSDIIIERTYGLTNELAHTLQAEYACSVVKALWPTEQD